MCNSCHCGCRRNGCGCSIWNNVLAALENLFPAGGCNNGCGCNNQNNGCGCNNQNNGCGCNNNNNGIALTGLDEFYIGPAPYAGNGNGGCGCNQNNGCGCNQNNGCGCGSNLNLSAYTACGNACYDAYYARQYALIPNANGCGICSCS